VAVVLALAAGFVWSATVLQFTQDDAFISLRYARNLVEGHGLVFNPGERVEGYSNFTWTLLLALGLKLGAPAVLASRWLGIAFGVLSILVAARLARSLEGRWGVASAGTAALVAGNCAFALWSTGGLETALYTFLVTAGLERGLAPDVGRRGRLVAAGLLCLAALSRPDGPLVFAVWFTIRLVDGWRARAGRDDRVRETIRARLPELAIFAGPLIPYGVWKLAYYGDLLPNTYYAKAGVSAVYLTRGIDYALDWFRAYGIFGVAPVLAVLSLAREGWRGVEARLLLVWLAVGAYVVVIGGDVLYLHRFWLPILPIGSVLVARGATWVGERALRGRALAATAAPAIVLAVLVTVGYLRNSAETLDRSRSETSFVTKMAQAGAWLKDRLPPDASIAVTTIGAIAYESDLHVIDMLGLTDREVARDPRMFDGLEDTWREVKYNAESVLRREPDAILFSTDVRPSSAAERALYLYESFYESYFSLYYRTRPWRKQAQTLHRRRPDAPPFRSDLVEVDGYGFIDEYIEGHLRKGRHRDHEGALEHFARAIEIGPEQFGAAREWYGITLHDLDRPGAIDSLRAIVADDPYATVAADRLAVHYLVEGNTDAAEPLLRRSVEINPDNSSAWAGLAEVERRHGNLDVADRYARRAISIWTTNAANALLLGRIALQRGDLETAGQAFAGTLELKADGELADSARRGLEAVRLLRSGELSLEELLSAQTERSGS